MNQSFYFMVGNNSIQTWSWFSTTTGVGIYKLFFLAHDISATSLWNDTAKFC